MVGGGGMSTDDLCFLPWFAKVLTLLLDYGV